MSFSDIFHLSSEAEVDLYLELKDSLFQRKLSWLSMSHLDTTLQTQVI